MSSINFMSMESGESKTKPASRCLLCWTVIASLAAIGLLIGVIVLATSPPATNNNTGYAPVRWCTISSDEQTKCLKMEDAFKQANMLPGVTCIAKSGVDSCVSALENSEADAITLDGGHVYNERSKLKPVMAEDYGEGDATYWAVAVVKKSDTTTFFTQSGLQGKKSCHTGLGKSAGWKMPVGTMKSLGIIKVSSSCDVSSAVGNLFGTVCAPGGDGKLCAGCDGTCEINCDGENFCGYTGAFRCLVSGGDVAFVKHTTVFDNTDGNNNDPWATSLVSQDYELLCKDGSRAPLAAYEICNMGKVPSHSVVVSVNAPASISSAVTEMLVVAQLKFGPHTSGNFQLFGGPKPDLLFKSSTKILLPLRSDCTAERFLGNSYLSNLLQVNCAEEILEPQTTSCVLSQYSNYSPSSLRWCVTTDAEMAKCRDLTARAQDFNIGLTIDCKLAADVDTCAQMIVEGTMDGVSMDGGEIYKAGEQLQPLAAETYNVTDAEGTTYYAVAVAKASDSSNLTRSGLQGKKTCHTGYGKTAGWNMPVGFMIENNIISFDNTTCNILDAMANFFGGSCVPGVTSLSSLSDQVKQKLCDICSGSGSNKCVTSLEPYSGYSGAFNCMKNGAGNIAFVKHLTALDTTLAPNPDDFKLLCPDGTTKPVDKYLGCNIAKVPSHAFMVSTRHSALYKARVWALLNQLQTNQTLFSSDGYGGSSDKDLLFKDSTKCLLKVDNSCTYTDFLGASYVNAVDGIQCRTRDVTTKPCQLVVPTTCTP
ncbi:melanotransferrin-like isoform X1 [Clavelina lepadiformis]|uniref:melanotransferrin-like isoform X1 n=1 Tax=Clavelina lepadiformis TaxID=159417 RepID=UPI004041A540